MTAIPELPWTFRSAGVLATVRAVGDVPGGFAVHDADATFLGEAVDLGLPVVFIGSDAPAERLIADYVRYCART